MAIRLSNLKARDFERAEKSSHSLQGQHRRHDGRPRAGRGRSHCRIRWEHANGRPEIVNGTGTIVAPDIIEAAERGSQPRCLELL
jgi:hypothetical protein